MKKKIIQIWDYVWDSRTILFVSFIVFLVALLICIDGFYTGFHNMDLCNNEKKIMEKVRERYNDPNFTLRERTMDGSYWSLEECFHSGLGNMIKHFRMSIFCGIGVGLCLALLWTNRKI